MSELPWSKFFWADWEADEGLRQCSLAAQGLWMRMLCICAKGDPIGFLAIAGNPLDVDGVAKAAGISSTEAETLMDELSRWGVFSRDRKQRIYSRRMVRDAKRSQEGRKHIKKRWSQSSESEEENPPPNRGPNRGATTQKPEARGQKEKTEPSGSAKKRASRLPEDWTLPEEWAEIAIGMGFPRDRLKTEADRMRDWSRSSKNGAKLDWLATWRNWIRSKLEDNPGWRTADAPPDSSFVTLPADHPDAKAVEKMNGKPNVVGQRGTVTLRKSEVEKATANDGELF